MSKQEKRSPRAMPVETIITRFKSKQNLLENNNKSTPITVNLVKKTNRKRGRPKKIVTVVKQVEQEIYPIVKRNIVNNINFEKKLVKKIVLAPKHCYKLIGGIKDFNKRKLCTPRKEISVINEERKQEPDMLKLVEDSGSLDEEDLLEILTCPSPVWWEDPPDGYIEEALFSRPQQQYEQKSIKTQLLEERNKEENQVAKVELSSNKVDNSVPFEINVINRDSTFINKRSKLELLLSNIKNKNVNRNSKKIKKKKKSKAKRKKGKKENFNPIKKLKNDKIDKSDKVDNDKRRSSLNLSDLGDDDILNHLENIDIPMDEHKEDDDDQMSAEYLDMSLFDDEFDIKDDDNVEQVKDKTNDDNLTNKVNNNDKASSPDFVTNKINDQAGEVNDKANANLLINEVNDKANGSDFLTNKINDQAEVNNKTNNDLLTNEVNDNDKANGGNLLTNKDNDQAEEVNDKATGGEFLKNKGNDKTEEVKKANDLLTNELNDNSKSEEVNDKSNIDNLLTNEVSDNIDDLLTVYKVIDNNPNKLQIIIPKTGNDKIDNYYKQMKKIKKVKDNSIMISEADAIRYCFVCSSIFDTENCGYCDKKKEYSCDICGVKVNAKSEMIKHLNGHINGVDESGVLN